MALPLSLLEIRREQRRVGALLGASKQLDIHIPPYRGIPSQSLFRSKHHTQLKRGKVDQSPPASTSLPEYHTKPNQQDATDVHKSTDTGLAEHSKPFIPAGTSRNNYEQLFSRHAFAGHQGDLVPSTLREVGKGMYFSLPIAQDSDIFLSSSKNVPKKQFSPKKETHVPSKKEYNHDDFARTSFMSTSKPSKKQRPRPKRKIPPDLDIEPPRQPKEYLTDYRLPKPKKSETLPSLPVPKDTSFNPKRTFSPKPKPIKRYHQDVVGQGVDVPLKTEPAPPVEQVKTLVEQAMKHNKVFPSVPSTTKVTKPPPTLTRKPSNIFEGFHRYKSVPKPDVPEQFEPKESLLPEPDSVLDEMDNESQSEAINSDKADEEDEEEEEEESSDEEMEDHNSPPLPDQLWERPPSRTNDNPWSEAYRKAVAAARRRNLPTLDDFNHRFTRAFTYSYLPNGHESSCECNTCLKNKAAKEKAKGRKKKSKKQKARSEMKKVLGNVKIYDYFKFAPKKR